MGHFAYTCSLSQMPIGGGDKIRFLILTPTPYKERPIGIHGAFFPRTVPLRAEYSNYGSIDTLPKASKPLQDLWLEALRHDIIPRGVGANRYHDVAVPKNLSWSQMLEGLWEGRLQVTRQYNPRPSRAQSKPIVGTPGIPTLARVEHQLLEAKQKICTEEGGEGFYVAELPSVGVELRWAGQKNYEKQLRCLLKKVSAFDTEYRVLISEKDSESVLLLCPKRYGKSERAQLNKQKDASTLYQAMVREDVWQAFCRMSVTDSWSNKTYSLPQFQEEIQKERARGLKYVVNRKALEATLHTLTDPEMKDKIKCALLDLRILDKPFRWGERSSFGSNVPFTVDPAFHANLLIEREKDIDSFWDDWAELAFVECVMSATSRAWSPAFVCGPQEAEWANQGRLYGLLGEVAAEHVREEAEERRKYDEEIAKEEAKEKEKYAKKKASKLKKK